jgi:hypothetical protein
MPSGEIWGKTAPPLVLPIIGLTSGLFQAPIRDPSSPGASVFCLGGGVGGVGGGKRH